MYQPRLRRLLSRTCLSPVFIAFLVLGTMVLSPLAQQAALAQATEEPPVTEEPVVDDPATEAPVATEDPTLAQPTEEPAAPETSTLTISVYRCDHPTFDPYFSGNVQQVLNTCVGQGYGQFTAMGPFPHQTGAGSQVTLNVVGGLEIEEHLAPGYDAPIANCFLMDATGTVVDQVGPGKASGGYWKVGGIQGDVHCDWYQVDRGVGEVYVVNMACPSSSGLFPEPSMTDLVAACTEPAGSKQFFVEHGAGLTRMVPSGGEFNDAYFEAIQAGPVAIWMDSHAEFDKARVFCQVTTLDGAEIAGFSEVSVSDFRATGLTLGHGQRLHCSWFNILLGPGLGDDGGDTAPTPTPTPIGTGTLRVALFTCPAGYDPEAPTADPPADCAPGPNGVTFTLTDDDPATSDLQTMTGDSIPFAVMFGGVPATDLTVTQTTPPGIGSMFVLGCGGGGVGPVPTFIDDTVVIGLRPNVEMTCRWFNIPGESATDDTEPPVIAREASPQSIAALKGTASLSIHAYSCPQGFDVSTITSNPNTACTPLDGIGFDIDDSIDDGAGRYIETGWLAPGMGTASDLPADTYTISAGARNGTTASFVWDCYDLAATSTRTAPLQLGNDFQIPITDGAQVRCDWFAVTGGTARAIVQSHACPILAPSYTLDLAGLMAQCTEDPGPIEYTIVSDIHQETQTATQTPLQLASFANVPSGTMAIVETIPDGFTTPIVYCGISLEDATEVSPPTRMPLAGSRQFIFTLNPGEVMFCNWFNVIGGFVDVHINVFACPTGFDAHAADLTTLSATCTGDPGTGTFSASDGGLYLQQRTASLGVEAMWDGMPAGNVRIEHELPDGFGLPVVVCGIDFEDGTTIAPPARAAVGSIPSIEVPLSAGHVLRCTWFQVPGGLAMVSIAPHMCSPAVDMTTATGFELLQTCNEPFPDTTFALTSGSFQAETLFTDMYYYADFPAVPSGEAVITAAQHPDLVTPVVSCRVQNDGNVSPSSLMPVTNGTSITSILAPHDWLICDWFTQVETDSTITITKYTCPEGTTYDEDDAWYQTTCTQAHAEVEFRLTHSEGDVSGTTDASGMVQWADVPLGPYSIQEYIPEGYGDPVVICGFTAMSGGAVVDAFPQRVDATGGYISGSLEFPKTSVFCFWYNIEAGPGTLTIHKYTCPPGYDPLAWNADPTVDCPDGANGIPFRLEGPGGYDNQTETGASVPNAAVFTDLEPGSYTVTEALPDDAAGAFVWDCTGQRMGSQRPTPLVIGTILQLNVGAGDDITCRWYNVQHDPYGRLTVVKYICSTEAFTSPVDCQVYEGGQGFDLAWWNGNGWEIIASGSTDGAGRFTWSDLDAGEYWLDEQGGEWCHLASDAISDDGNWLNVYDGQETVVSVYNCGGDPGKPGETPTKYPNTGVMPMREEWRLSA